MREATRFTGKGCEKGSGNHEDLVETNRSMSVLGPGNERGPLMKVLFGNEFQLVSFQVGTETRQTLESKIYCIYLFRMN